MTKTCMISPHQDHGSPARSCQINDNLRPGTKNLNAAKMSVPRISASTPLPLNGKMNAPGNRAKKPFEPACRCTCTCTGTHSLPQRRQNLCGAPPTLREVTHSSQKNNWQLLHRYRPGVRG